MRIRPHRLRLFPYAVVSLVLGVSPAAAQDQSVGEILSFLLTNRSIVTDDFVRDEAAAAAARDAISDALLVELSSLPIASSSGGFAYRFNPALGTIERASDSFGPFFVERALTAGRGRASFGLSVRYAKYDSLDGNDLRSGTFVTTANRFVDEATPFDQETLRLNIQTTTATFVSSVGIGNRVELGVAVPIVQLKLSGERVNTFRGQSTLQASASSEVVGIADIAIRAKYHVFGSRGSGLALAGEVRPPTGSREDLLGTGKAAYRGAAIASVEGTAFGAHANVGYTSGGISDQLDYSGGVALAPADRFTLTAEVLGREVRDLGPLGTIEQQHPTIRGVNTLRVAPTTGNLRTAFAVAGFKWNLGSSWLVSANVLFPLTDRGLKSQVVPAIAIDYSFGG